MNAEDIVNEVGRNITNAVKLLRDTHVELSALFGALDDLFRRQGLEPVGDTRVAHSQTARIGAPDRWMPMVLFRAYVEAKAAELARVLVLEIRLAPEDGDQPILVLLALKLSKPMTSNAFWNTWNWSNATEIERTLNLGGPRTINAEEVGQGYPPVLDGRMQQLRLCALTGQRLGEDVVQPAMKLFGELV
jgi:hypothetical protein